MDLPLWESSDDQVAYETRNNTEDLLLGDYSFGYGCDILEEDVLNEKSCMQVLKIWIDKADKDIVKLEEDILMLKCQLVLDDEDWSEQCCAALREKTDQLDILIQSLNENRVETEELPPRLYEFLKPLLENYLAKPKQAEESTARIPDCTAVELSNKKLKPSTAKDWKLTEENVCTTMLKTYERKSKSTEIEEREISHPQNQNAVIREFSTSAHTCPNGKDSENITSKPSTLDGMIILDLDHAESERSPDKSEQTDPMVKESSASTSVEKVNSRENEENHNKAISKAGAISRRLPHESKVTLSHLKLDEPGSPISETVEEDHTKPTNEASSKVRKARVYRRANKGDVLLSVKPSSTNFSEIQEAVDALEIKMKTYYCSMNNRTEHVEKPRELERHVQVQQLIYPLNPEGQGAQKKCQENPEAAETLQTERNKTPCSMNYRTKHVKRPRLELEHQVQVQQKGIETVVVNQDKLSSSMKPDSLGPQKKCKEEAVDENPCSINDTEHKKPRLESGHQIQTQQRRDMEIVAVHKTKLTSPSKPEGQGPQKKCKEKDVFAEGVNKNVKKETQQELNMIHKAGTSVVIATPILLPKDVRRLSFSPQTKCKKEDLTSSHMRPVIMEHDASNSRAEEATDGVKNMLQTSTLCIKNDKEKLTCKELRAIAKSQKLRGYYKLKKEELKERLGL